MGLFGLHLASGANIRFLQHYYWSPIRPNIPATRDHDVIFFSFSFVFFQGRPENDMGDYQEVIYMPQAPREAHAYGESLPAANSSIHQPRPCWTAGSWHLINENTTEILLFSLNLLTVLSAASPVPFRACACMFPNCTLALAVRNFSRDYKDRTCTEPYPPPLGGKHGMGRDRRDGRLLS